MEIINYPNYLLYQDGRVLSKSNNKFLKPSFDKRYLFYTLYQNGKRKCILIHRLLALHFIPNPENKPCVDHINRNKTDNSLKNLRWVTHLENSQNFGCHKTNISGHRNISWDKSRNKWIVNVKGKKVKRFINKKDALCYKYIRLLQVKTQLKIS